MGKKLDKSRGEAQITALAKALHTNIPHLAAWLAEEDEVRELRIKHQDDNTFLAIAKSLDADGGNLICFGGGYGFLGCLLTLDAAIQANRWRVDAPWSGKKK